MNGVNPDPNLFDKVTHLTTEEMIGLLGWQASPGRRWAASHLLRSGARRFARHAVSYNRHIQTIGWCAANRLAIRAYTHSLIVLGIGHIPQQGPLLIASNHPGIFDFMAISAACGREDLRILAYSRPFLHSLPGVDSHMIYVTRNAERRVGALLEIDRDLRGNRSVLIFPAGVSEPDPSCLPGAIASLENWQSSLALLLRRAPQTKIIPTLVSGVFWPPAFNLSLIRRRPSMLERIRLGSTLQVMWLTATGHPTADVRVTFGAPLCGEDLLQAGNPQAILEVIRSQMRSLIQALPVSS
jgi:hypothetical protein